MRGDRALIIFARYPRPGQVKTRLGMEIGMEKAARVYRSLAGATFDVGLGMAEKGVNVYLFFEPSTNIKEMRSWVKHNFTYLPQEGSDLGQRMKHSFDVTFNDGATRSVIVGTDIPGLDSDVVGDAFNLLRRSEVVIGPSSDGGYYLLGMQSPARDLFSGITWSTESVFTDTVDRLVDLRIQWSRLKTLADIDTLKDYDRFLGRMGDTLRSKPKKKP